MNIAKGSARNTYRRITKDGPLLEFNRSDESDQRKEVMRVVPPGMPGFLGRKQWIRCSLSGSHMVTTTLAKADSRMWQRTAQHTAATHHVPPTSFHIDETMKTIDNGAPPRKWSILSKVGLLWGLRRVTWTIEKFYIIAEDFRTRPSSSRKRMPLNSGVTSTYSVLVFIHFLF